LKRSVIRCLAPGGRLRLPSISDGVTLFRNVADIVQVHYAAGQKNPTMVIATAIHQNTRNHFLAQKCEKA